MAYIDNDGMTRVSLEWKIEGRNDTKIGHAYNVREKDRQATERSIRLGAMRGDTVTITEI